MHEALFYSSDENKKVKCRLCNHFCTIKNGKRGICQVRENQEGRLVSLVYGKIISANNDPIEKKPLFHVLPGTKSYSIATVGCNFRCLHCQNYQISQYPRYNDGEIPGDRMTPSEVVTNAMNAHAKSISYTYVEPTIFYEFAYDCGEIAKKQGLKNIFVSNGYMSKEAATHLAKVLDAINIDLKAFSDNFYKTVCKARLKPVLKTIELMYELGVWVEVTTLVIPGWNDSKEELKQLATFIKKIDPGIPWHVTAFYPTYKMLDRPPTPPETLHLAREIGLEAGLNFVYEGNIPGKGTENTYCPGCKELVIERYGFTILKNYLNEGRCPKCNSLLPGLWQ